MPCPAMRESTTEKCGIAGFAGEIYTRSRFVFLVGSQREDGSFAKTDLIILSCRTSHRGSFRFHQVTMLLSFHFPGFAAFATISSVILIRCAFPLALNAWSNPARSAMTVAFT